MAKNSLASSASISIDLASVADGTIKESDPLDFGTSGPFEVEVTIDVKLQTGSPAGDKCIYYFACGSEDGTNYGDPSNNTGAKGTVSTLRSPTNARPLGVMNTPDSGALTYRCNPMSLRRAFGGSIPRKVTILVQNKTGITFDATEGNHRKSYTAYTTA